MVTQLFKNGKLFLIKKQTNILSAALVITIFYGFSMILGVIRNRLLISHFYDCCRIDLDAYWAAFRLPDMIFQLLVIGALSAAFIPVFSEYLKKDEKEAYKIASSFINLLTGVFALSAILIFIFARPLSVLITGAFSSYQIDLMASLTQAMLLAQFFFLFSSFLTGIIQTHQRFLIPALAPVVYNAGIIFGIVLLSPIFGIYGPAIGVVIGAFLHFLIQLPLASSLGFVYHFLFVNLREKGVREILKLMVPRTLSLAVLQVEATVALFLATSLASGSLTLFYLAQQLMQLPISLVGVPIGQAAFPILSQKDHELAEFKKIFLSSFFQIIYIVFPIVAILVVLRIPVVRIAFGAKGFPWQATILTGKALAVFSLAIVAQASIQLIMRGFYAFRDTKTPLLVSLFSVSINIVMSFYFIFNRNWGILGLATATSIASFLQALLLFYLLDKKVSHFNWTSVWKPFAKIFTASVITAVFLWLPMRFLDQYLLDTTKTINLIILSVAATLVGLVVYFLVSWVFKIEEMGAYLSLFKKIGKWQQLLAASDEILEPQLKS